MTVEASKAEPYDPAKLTDLGTTMLSLFENIFKCQEGFVSEDIVEREKATAAVKQIIDGFENVIQ